MLAAHWDAQWVASTAELSAVYWAASWVAQWAEKLVEWKEHELVEQ